MPPPPSLLHPFHAVLVLTCVLQDIRLVFTNAMTFNPPSHLIHSYAASLLADLEASLEAYVRVWVSPDAGEEELKECKLAVGPEVVEEMGFKAAVNPAAAAASDASDALDTTGAMDEDAELSRKRTLSRVLSEDSYSSLKCFEDPTSVTWKKPKIMGTVGTIDDLAPVSVPPALPAVVSAAVSSPAPLSSLPFDARRYNTSQTITPFTGPLLSPKVLNPLISDLSKAIQRMTDDLFVLRLEHPLGGQQKLSGRALGMLMALVPDTSDPDAVVSSRLLDSRYTFLGKLAPCLSLCGCVLRHGWGCGCCFVREGGSCSSSQYECQTPILVVLRHLLSSHLFVILRLLERPYCERQSFRTLPLSV